MKRYWVIFFLIALILFQGYVSLMSKNQTITLAQNVHKIPPHPTQTVVITPAVCLQSFLYPHVTTTEITKNSLFLQTEDDPSQAVSWFKNVLQEQNFSLGTDMVNTTNGVSTTMLVGDKDNQHIAIVIGRAPEETATTIFVHMPCN